MDGAVSNSETSHCDTLTEGGSLSFQAFPQGVPAGWGHRSWAICDGVLEMCQIPDELKMLPFFVMHSQEANSAQDLAAVAGLC